MKYYYISNMHSKKVKYNGMHIEYDNAEFNENENENRVLKI